MILRIYYRTTNGFRVTNIYKLSIFIASIGCKIKPLQNNISFKVSNGYCPSNSIYKLREFVMLNQKLDTVAENKIEVKTVKLDYVAPSIDTWNIEELTKGGGPNISESQGGGQFS